MSNHLTKNFLQGAFFLQEPPSPATTPLFIAKQALYYRRWLVKRNEEQRKPQMHSIAHESFDTFLELQALLDLRL